MTETFDMNSHTFRRYGLILGVKLAFKLSVVYALIIALLLGLASFNPILLLLTFLVALIIGIIPSLIIGGFAGIFFTVVFARFGKSLTEWKVAGTGWLIGILCALLLVLTLGFVLSGGEMNSVLSVLDYGGLVVCPGLVALFAVGWLARKTGEPYLEAFLNSEDA